MTLRIAMWSGPRNISTAMLRAFENRPDTAVCDEPLYAFYLARTGAPHPGAEEIVAQEETDWRAVAERLTGPAPGGAPVFYQKHMAHHLLPEIEHDWLARLEHCFLIRDPREMLLSLEQVTPEPDLSDTGLPQQVELYEEVRARTGQAPPILDARDVLEDPRGMLAALCRALGIEFSEAMLAWPPGPRETDGVWAPYWYGAVERSTGFQEWRPRAGELTSELGQVLERCREPYAFLHHQRLRA